MFHATRAVLAEAGGSQDASGCLIQRPWNIWRHSKYRKFPILALKRHYEETQFHKTTVIREKTNQSDRNSTHQVARLAQAQPNVPVLRKCSTMTTGVGQLL